MSTLERSILGWIAMLLGVGEAWLFAWVFDPEFTSGTVWFLGFLFGGVQQSLAGLHSRVVRP